MSQSSNGENQPQLRQKCPFGYSCAGMMMTAGIIAHDCENLNTCLDLAKAENVPWNALEQPTFDLIAYRLEREEEREHRRREYEEEAERRRITWEAGREERERRQQEWQEELQRVQMRIQVTKHEAALFMLRTRGNPQHFDDFAIVDPLQELIEAANHLQSLIPTLQAYDNRYIAPNSVEVCIYSVKRPPRNKFPASWSLREVRQAQNIFYYHKLKSRKAEFEGVQPDKEGNIKPCKAIHLSKSEDARNIQGRLGIERRNRLSQIQTRLVRAARDIAEAIAIAEDEFDYDDILLRSREAEHDDQQPTILPQPDPE